MKTKFVLCTLLVTLLFVNGYTQGLPPPMAMPSAANTALVDSIILASHHEAYFTNYCEEKVKAYATTNKWTPAKTSRVLKSIRFDNYSSTVYNSYAAYSADDLRKLLDVLKLLNRDANNWTSMTLTNYMMQSNLDVFIDNLLEEKYVTK